MKIKYLLEDLVWKLPRRARKALIGDSVLLRGTVIIHMGNKVIVGRAHNRLVSLGIKALLQELISEQTATTQFGMSRDFNLNAASARMRVGTDVANPTTEGMTALSAEITTDRNSANTRYEKIAAGQYRIKWVATWNAGTLAAVTIGELGLYTVGMAAQSDASLPIDNGLFTSSSATQQLFSRLSSASGDFTAFLINVTVPLTIEWRLDVTF